MISKEEVSALCREAISLGATSSAVILSEEIEVRDDLAALCNGEYVCPYYGLGANCPPHVEGPARFRDWREKSVYSITVKIELPTSVMFSDERKGVMRLLHQVVAGVERKAVESGFELSRAFAGGSCKELFCGDHEKCRVLAGEGPCRHGDTARPSLSGFGVDVAGLMRSSGWPANKAEEPESPDSEETSWVAGLVLLL